MLSCWKIDSYILYILNKIFYNKENLSYRTIDASIYDSSIHNFEQKITICKRICIE